MSLNAQGGSGGSNTTGEIDLLGGSAAGGGGTSNPPPANNAGAGATGAGASANGASGGAGDNGGAGNQTVQIPSNWKDLLSPEIRDAGFMKNINDVQTLAKSFANAQKMIGADKLPIPGPNATAEDWKTVFSRLGVPEKLEEYNLGLDKDQEAKFSPEYLADFKKIAHESGMLPSQAKKMTEWMHATNQKLLETHMEERKAEVAKHIQELKTEWGAAYDQKVKEATKAIKEFGGEGALEKFRASGLTTDKDFVKFVAAVGETLREGKIKEGEPLGGSPNFTPEQARRMINELKGTANSPYYNASHPEHEATKNKVRSLYAMAFPTEQKTG